MRSTTWFAVGWSALLLGACSESEDHTGLGYSRQALQVECVDDAGGIPETSWVCPEDLTVECNDPEGTDVALIFSEPPEAQRCSNVNLSVAPEGPFDVGTHSIEISSSIDGGTLLCEATLTVVDTTPPVVAVKQVELWPPNHEWQTVSAEECFEIDDACDDEVTARVLWATSDEPFDSTGDGNTEPDMQFVGCDQVQLRAERKGNGNGRAYRMGWHFTDEAGNSSESICEVVVPHDQGQHEAIAGSVVMEISNDAACQPDAG